MYGDRRTGLTGARPCNDRGVGPACGGDSTRLGLLVSHVSSRADTRPVSLEVEGQLAGRHELLHDLVRDPLAPGLVLCDQGLQDLYERLLELAGEHGSAGVILPETGGQEKAPAPPSSARAARPASQPALPASPPVLATATPCPLDYALLEDWNPTLPGNRLAQWEEGRGVPPPGPAGQAGTQYTEQASCSSLSGVYEIFAEAFSCSDRKVVCTH